MYGFNLTLVFLEMSEAISRKQQRVSKERPPVAEVGSKFYAASRDIGSVVGRNVQNVFRNAILLDLAGL